MKDQNPKLVFPILIILVLVGLGWYFFGFQSRESLRIGEVRIGDRVFRVEVAEDMMSRAKGLSGRDGLDEDKGMLFIFGTPGTYGFWMKDMKFAIDIVWISGDRVVGFSENIQPQPEKSVFSLTTHYPPEAVDRVLELNAGAVKEYGFETGDLVEFRS